VLDPRFKITYHKLNKWSNEEIAEVMKILVKVFEQYKELRQEQSPETTKENQKSERSKIEEHIFFMFENDNKKTELDKYLDAPIFPNENGFNVLEWWKVSEVFFFKKDFLNQD
jgi:hypothetical protein